MAELDTGLQTEYTKKESAEIKAELEKAYSDEDIFWCRRSKVNWSSEGDPNTSYFHGLFNRSGVWCEKDREVESIITDYFGELFQTSNPEMAVMDEVIAQIDPRISSDVASQLSLPFTLDEVFSALSHMAPLKSPGPDGLPAIFFEKYWNILCSNIVTCILDFLNCIIFRMLLIIRILC